MSPYCFWDTCLLKKGRVRFILTFYGNKRNERNRKTLTKIPLQNKHNAQKGDLSAAVTHRKTVVYSCDITKHVRKRSFVYWQNRTRNPPGPKGPAGFVVFQYGASAERLLPKASAFPDQPRRNAFWNSHRIPWMAVMIAPSTPVWVPPQYGQQPSLYLTTLPFCSSSPQPVQ